MTETNTKPIDPASFGKVAVLMGGWSAWLETFAHLWWSWKPAPLGRRPSLIYGGVGGRSAWSEAFAHLWVCSPVRMRECGNWPFGLMGATMGRTRRAGPASGKPEPTQIEAGGAG